MLMLLGACITIVFVIRVLLRPHRAPTSRIAWIVVILVLPMVGPIIYLLLGETNIGKRRVQRMLAVGAKIPKLQQTPGWDCELDQNQLGNRDRFLFKVGASISGYQAVSGNHGTLMDNSNSTIDKMVEDIDGAKNHVHLLFYIWMPDNNGTKIADALKRAVSRGVKCRAMVDDIGSHLLIKSPLWGDMQTQGVDLCRVLRVGNPLLRMFSGRIDLRNHRKIVVIDNHITYCGSQNCADPEFLTKAKYAPWVDTVIRFTGPIARQNQHLFATDWMAYTDEDISKTLQEPLEDYSGGFVAQVIASGPTARFAAVPETFESVAYSARSQLFITTPYYVPIESLQAAICAAGNRGVDTTIIFPARNDDFAVGATCRSYYEQLLSSGVKIYEYQVGILHAKTMTVDNEVTLIGSANMDRRSFDLNYENNILFHDPELTAQLRIRQQEFLADSERITIEQVEQWSWKTRIWNNTMAIFGPIL